MRIREGDLRLRVGPLLWRKALFVAISSNQPPQTSVAAYDDNALINQSNTNWLICLFLRNLEQVERQRGRLACLKPLTQRAHCMTRP